MTTAGLLTFLFAVIAAILLLIFILVPLFRVIGWLISAAFRGLGWIIGHLFEFIGGVISDVIRFIGALLASILLAPLSVLNIIIGRWSAAGHFADSVKRECKVAGACLYRIVLRRPLKLVMLHGLLEGIEQRVPEAMAAAPSSDRPNRRTGQFPGYTIIGSLRGGGSGAKLYIARPEATVQRRYPTMPERVVIKSFALTEGSTLPQIVRESRALECAKQLGLVFEHAMDSHRFFYVMPYHEGEHLGIVTRELHGRSEQGGLDRKQLATVLSYTEDLISTLSAYHRGGLWHKDVKPENIIINRGQANLVDLGLVTPLQSAMTLTTHGTEYFRDPEMVRLALRGVKVHQVNGVKFDIYAGGAVLYFMLENTFPPHGALSRFTKRSPDALRWIVRRAMADYTHRYETADEMLADLRAVAAAADSFAVKPADLPSMAGGAAVDAALGAARAAVHAGAPMPPPPPHREAAPAAAGAVGATPAGAGQEAVPPRRPELQITNWWTGAYEVANSGPARTGEDSAHAAARAAREEASAFQHQVADLRWKVQSGAMSARKAAREQVRAARQRAKEIRRRARDHRQRAVAERQPSAMLIALALLALLAIGAIIFLTITMSGRSRAYTYAVAESVPPAAPQPPAPSVLLVRSIDRAADHPGTMTSVKEIIERVRRENNYRVVINDEVVESSVRVHLERWLESDDPGVRHAFESALRELELRGVLYVSQKPGEEQLRSNLIELSEGAPMTAGAPALPYLLINDHPTKHDPAVALRIEHALDQYTTRGWKIVTDDLTEAHAREALPPVPTEGLQTLPPRLARLLAEGSLGGILHVHARPGVEPAEQRVEVTVIDAPPVPAAPAAPDAVPPAAPVEVQEITEDAESAAPASGRTAAAFTTAAMLSPLLLSLAA